uniref:Uncharacterized protein n=1 Tax=Oryza punctata TaxID=4537 RepID=A0A0E0JW90_ORYPU
MAKKKDNDDITAVYTSVMDHVIGEVHDDLVTQGIGDGVGLGVLAAIRARWPSWHGAIPELRAALDGNGDGARPDYKPAADGGYCYNAPSSGPHHDAVVKEEEEVAAADNDDAFFPAPAATPIVLVAAALAPETANDGYASRTVVTRDLLGTLGAKCKRYV